MTPVTPDPRLQRALDKFLAQGGSFVLPDSAPPHALLPEPPGGPPADTRTHAALPTPSTIPHAVPRVPRDAPTPPPAGRLPHRAVIDANAVLPSLDHVVWSVSPDGSLVFLIAGAVERVLGLPAEYFVDRPGAWTKVVPGPERPALLRAFRRVAETNGFVVEHAIRVGGVSRRVVTRAKLVRRPDGGPLRVDGTTTEVVTTAVVRDLEARLAAAEARVKQAARLEALGRLVTGVAHDFNNCLTVVSGNIQLVRDHLPPGDALRDRTDEAVEHVAAAATVARQLVAFGRPASAAGGPIDPNAEVRGVERLLRRLTGHELTFDVLLSAGLPPAAVGSGGFLQVVLNLVANARDATPAGGTVTLRTAETVVTARRPGWPVGLPAGRYVAVTVTDTGVGMTEEVKARVFDPYFTTKGAAGAGVGLATLAEVVRAARGHVEIESAPGWGTSVRVFFPLASGPPAAPPPVPPAAPRPATILLVQDATAVRDLAAVALQHAGYRVLEADDGVTGEQRARLYAGRIDLLVADVGLAKQDGPALAAALRAARPGLKVLLVADSPTDAAPCLTKPYTPADLLAAVRQALDE
jgi:signal transduction histidine kinase